MSGEQNKKLKSVVCAGIAVLALAGYQKEARASLAKRYFPLNVGNSWTYTNYFVEPNDPNEPPPPGGPPIPPIVRFTFTIIGTEEIDGHTYYKFNDYFNIYPPPPNGEHRVTRGRETLFRYDSEADRVLMIWAGEDAIRYDFMGSGWYSDPAGGGWCRLKQSGVNCSVPAGEFSDCINFQFDWWPDEGPDAYAHGEYLAANVGNIKFVRPGGGLSEGDRVTFELQSYRIVPYCGDPNHPYPIGDLNHDCRVNLLDLAILAAHWLERVNLEPVVYITSPPDGFEFHWLTESVWIVANAWDVDGSVVKVEFFVNGKKKKEDNDGSNGWKIVTNFDVGTYILTAKATDNDGATTTSPPVTITAVEGPDLTVSESDITFSNPNPASGEEVTMTVTVHNIGGVDAGEFVVYISLSCSLDGIIWTIPMPWDWITVPHLPARSSTTISKENVSFLGGMSGIMVDVDWGNQIDESNEQNNWTGKVIEIQP